MHSGSRGLGSSVLAKARKDEPNPYILPNSPSFAPYIAHHDYAVRWAVANRDLIAHRIDNCLHPDAPSEGHATARKVVDITHNSVQQMSIQQEGGDAKHVFIHRKGAAPATTGVAPCAGSRGDFSWLLQPVGDGVQNG